MQMLLAVLGKIGYQLYDRDVFSAAGGIRITEPAADRPSPAPSPLVIKRSDGGRTLMFGDWPCL